MDENTRKKLAEAFDSGELDELICIDKVDDRDSEEYLSALKGIEDVLRTEQRFEIPSNFAMKMAKRLPSADPLKKPAWLKLYKPLLFVVSILLSIIFAEPLGLSSLTSAITGMQLQPVEVDIQVVFVVGTSIGMLIMLWIMLNSMYSIRSRRIEN